MSKSKVYIPAHLKQGDTHLKALFHGQAFKTGDQVTLEGKDGLWDVVETQDPYNSCFVHHSWNNNI